jgi:hypothetical protein
VAGRHVAFMSYARFDDDQYNGELTEFRKLLSAEVRAQTGREFVIFQDREHIPWGESWQKVIDEALDTVALLLVIITPGFFASAACRIEVARFLERERELGRSDLILPLYYISAREIDDPAVRDTDELARVLASRQYADWRDLRFEPLSSPTAHKAIGKLASRMTNAFWQTPRAQDRPADGRARQTGSAPASKPYAGLIGDPGQASTPQYQRGPWQSSEPFRAATGSPPAPTPPAPTPPASYPPPAPSAPYPSPALPASPAPPTSYPSSAPAIPPQWAARTQTPQHSQEPWQPPAPGKGDAGRTPPTAHDRWNLVAWPPRRRTIVVGGTLAALLVAAGTVYAVAAPGSGAGAAAATLGATLTVPGGGTVDTVWISPDGKRIAAARTDEASDIYVWNTANPGSPTTLTVPPVKVGTSVHQAMIENIAFSADDASMTVVGFPESTGPITNQQSYVLDQWNLTTGKRTTPWSIAATPSNISFSNDNSAAVESVKGGVNVVNLLPPPATSSPLTLPGGSALSDGTSYDLDLNGNRMLYSPKTGTYSVWDFTQGKAVDTWSSGGLSYLSPDGKTALVFYYDSKQTTIYPPPILLDLAAKAPVTPADPRWEDQLVSSTKTNAYVSYSTDGTVITTERAGGETDLWSTVTHKFLLTISDPNYRDDSSYAVVGPGGSEVVIFGQKGTSGRYQYHRLYVWDTGLR